MGFPWKMFTGTQGQELIDNTTSEWYSKLGMNGRKFINKTDSTKYIFLPAAGYWDGTNHGYYGASSGSTSSYRSTKYISSSAATCLVASSGSIYMGAGPIHARRNGFPIRGVK